MINITENLANNVTIVEEYSSIPVESNQYVRKDDLYDEYGISTYTVLIEDYHLLKPNGEQIYKTNFSVDMNEKGEYTFKSSAFMFKHTMIFKYADIMNKVEYKSKFEYVININVDVNNDLHFFLWGVSNSLLTTDNS